MLRNYGSIRDYGAELKSWSVKFLFSYLFRFLLFHAACGKLSDRQ